MKYLKVKSPLFFRRLPFQVAKNEIGEKQNTYEPLADDHRLVHVQKTPNQAERSKH